MKKGKRTNTYFSAKRFRKFKSQLIKGNKYKTTQMEK